MRPLYCRSAGDARDCTSCKHNPMNQQGMAQGQPISPPIKRDGKCPHYVMVIKPRGTP
jgi:hypothetical protein